MKKWVKRLLISLGILAVIFLLANLGLNFWLKTQLPKYIKNNTDYKVSYKLLDIDLGSGNILATGIAINSKNPQNTSVIGIQGTIDTLKVSRLGIYDAIFHKTISSQDLLLANPNLNITLAKPADKKAEKKKNPVLFKNISIHKGNISVFKYTKQKFLEVKKLNLFVENLQMNEDSMEDKLPIVFDKYNITGEGFFFRPDNVYALKISKITTTSGQMLIENFKLIPLLTFNEFRRFYPKKSKLFQADIPKIELKDIVLEKNKVSLANAEFHNPLIKVYTTNAVAKKSDKPMNFEANLGNIKLNNGILQIFKPDGNTLLYGQNINFRINEFAFNKESAENLIPVNYKDFNFSGKNVHYTGKQNIEVGSVALDRKSGEMRNIVALPTDSETLMNFKVNHVAFNINTWGIVNKKLNLDVKDVLVDGVRGTIKARGAVQKKKIDLGGIQFPLILRKIVLKNSDIIYDKGDQPLTFNDLNARINNVELKPKPDNTGLAVTVKDYELTTKNFAYKTKFYNMSVGLLKVGKNKVQVNNFAMKPLVSRAQFITMITVEKDLYDLKAGQITVDGRWDLFSNNKFINASSVVIQSADANIFRSKIPADDPKEKPLYSKLLRSIKIPMYVKNLDLKNSILVYEEDTPESTGSGKLVFSNFNMNVKNLNSAKFKGKPTQVQIKIDCSFMNQAPFAVDWNFDVANQHDNFTISGKAVDLPAQGINPFIRPYLHITATGTIQEMLFSFKGNPAGLGGTFNLKHKDLKIAILNKDNKEKKGFLTAVANLFLKSNSGKFPESVMVENVQRDPTKSFFNLFWKGVQEGLKKTLIGVNPDKAKKAVEKTVSAVKDVKKKIKDIKETAVSGKEDHKVTNPEQPEEEKEKKGFLKNIFKKKEKPETE